MDPIQSDARFTKLSTDKKFRSVGKKHRKVKIDKRFQGIFSQEKFVNKCAVDKRGRPKHLTAKENFEKFYDLESSDSSEDDEVDDTNVEEAVKPVSDEEDEDSDEDKSKIEDKIRSKLRDNNVDYARGEGALYSDSSSSEESDSDAADEDDTGEGPEPKVEMFDKWGEMDREAERTEDATHRMAVCNMDWDRVGASDIFLALSSFCPGGGSVVKVEIFLSDFGRERLEEEQTLGPVELRGQQGGREEEVILDTSKRKEIEAEAMDRVRQYQVNRLKYYYAVVEFDSVDSADRVYSECDGMEYELSATRFDLRFVPDEMEFGDSPTDACLTRPDQDKYQAKNFQTTALQQQKVELTWDETDPQREKSMKKAFETIGKDGDLDELDNVKNLIASASEDDSEDDVENSGDERSDGDTVNDKDMINKYRALLADINSKEEKQADTEGNMEVSWHDPEPAEQPEPEELGPWEKYLEKKKNKKKKRKEIVNKEGSEDDIPEGVDLNDPFFAEELGTDFGESTEGKSKKKKKKGKDIISFGEDEEDKSLNLMVMDSDDDKDHFNFKDIVETETKTGKAKKKWKKKKKELEVPLDDNFSVDVSDDRFSALFSRPDFNIDPTDSSFKKTKNMDKIITEKLKRKANPKESETKNNEEKKPKLDPEISSSLKTVKNKWKKNAKKSNK